MNIKRKLESKLKVVAEKSPAIAILGPRQSGKTTLAKMVFPDYEYVLFEDMDTRESFKRDPRGFLSNYLGKKGVIFDEAQLVPDLFSYLQGIIDQDQKPGYFILTGSQNFLLNQAISQSLSGRIRILTLLPLSITELEEAKLLPVKETETIFKGFYPKIYSKDLHPGEWYPDYIQTYIERDVRTLKNVSDLGVFQRFIKLCAGRIGQVVNYSSLANDCDISVNTAKAWISLLESTYILFTLNPYYKNFSKRIIKSPKLFFYDTGLACSLLGIQDVVQLETHYLKVGLFEQMIISEIIKQEFNQGIRPEIYFWRDRVGNEVDLIFEKGTKAIPIEIKSGKTINQSFFKGLDNWAQLVQTPEKGFVVYSGDRDQNGTKADILSWKNLDKIANF